MKCNFNFEDIIKYSENHLRKKRKRELKSIWMYVKNAENAMAY